MIFERSVLLPVDAATAFAWHARPGAFDRLVPPWQDVRVVAQRGTIENGDELIFRVGMGPLGMRWHAVHEGYVSGRQFVDVQKKGPFAAWRHVHAFEDRAEGSLLVDRIDYRLPGGPPGQWVGGPLFARDLRRMFAYRHATTVDDLALHARYRDQPRRRALLVSAPDATLNAALAATVRGMLTTGGHTVAEVDLAADDEAACRAVADAVPDAVVLLDSGAARSRLAAYVDGLARIAARPMSSAAPVVVVAQDAGLDNRLAPSDEVSVKPNAAMPVVRCVDLRLGTVLKTRTGLLAHVRHRRFFPMMLPTQPEIPWISRDDAGAAVVHALMEPTVAGVVRVGSSSTISQRSLGQALSARGESQLLARASNFAPDQGEKLQEDQWSPQAWPPLRHPTVVHALRYLMGWQESGPERASAGE